MKMLKSMMLGVLGLLALPSACADTPATAIVLALSSEANVPKELDSVTIQVTRGSDVRFARTYRVDKATNTLNIPGTLSVQPRDDEDASQPVKVQILGNLADQQVVVRTATMAFASDKQKLLRLSLRYSCMDVPLACAEGETCIGGRCTSDRVAPEGLPDLPTGEELFPLQGAPGCFDNDDAACARERTDIEVTEAFVASGCEFDTKLTAEQQKNINVFAFWASRADQGHPLVLDAQSAEGWQAVAGSPSKLKLSEGLCKAVSEKRIRKLSYNQVCGSKLESQPLCVRKSGAAVAQKFFENACHQCVYEYPDCKAPLDKARSQGTDVERQAVARAEACEFDGRYDTLDECSAVKSCFFGSLAPMLDCQGASCGEVPNLIEWGNCLQEKGTTALCAETCKAAAINASVCEKP